MRIAVFGLLLFFGLGAPVALWLPRSINDRWSAAPVFGLAIFGVVATLAYFNELAHLHQPDDRAHEKHLIRMIAKTMQAVERIISRDKPG